MATVEPAMPPPMTSAVRVWEVIAPALIGRGPSTRPAPGHFRTWVSVLGMLEIPRPDFPDPASNTGGAPAVRVGHRPRVNRQGQAHTLRSRSTVFDCENSRLHVPLFNFPR